ncbi:MAG: hypothetical protein ACJAX1_001293 [Neolewinella sp.]|jgi:hypothetical protein
MSSSKMKLDRNQLFFLQYLNQLFRIKMLKTTEGEVGIFIEQGAWGLDSWDKGKKLE